MFKNIICPALICSLGISSCLANAATQQPRNFLSIFHPENTTIVLQGGGFNATQGDSQNISIAGLIGDHFSVTQHNDQNFLLGLGYYINAWNNNCIQLLYGLNAYYLADTKVKGKVVQEYTFTNLSYHYSITNLPVYVATKAIIQTNINKFNVTVDLGFGPNIIQTTSFRESSLDGGITIPDKAFSGESKVVLSAAAGIGLQFKEVFKDAAIEIGYRFFYLGEGKLRAQSEQIQNNLTTGNSYANALILSIAV